ncbi:hypothetical protein C9I90_18780 [Photobacterium aphoticum]|uniref:Uncharacterized protein n=1 Tax=Photobacterium aphoticum TaxID=754436 RepID=A0A0J1JB47_9GAMM|nr:hypothetical protein ABT58_20745 [Photobacterium aphoticum]PSU54851.1 hypothetical protein C9I90_18780 [Photobacterium aphoticum]
MGLFFVQHLTVYSIVLMLISIFYPSRALLTNRILAVVIDEEVGLCLIIEPLSMIHYPEKKNHCS